MDKNTGQLEHPNLEKSAGNFQGEDNPSQVVVSLQIEHLLGTDSRYRLLIGPSTTPPVMEDWDIRLKSIKLPTRKETMKPTYFTTKQEED